MLGRLEAYVRVGLRGWDSPVCNILPESTLALVLFQVFFVFLTNQGLNDTRASTAKETFEMNSTLIEDMVDSAHKLWQGTATGARSVRLLFLSNVS